MHRYMPDYVDERKVTLLECIEKSIRNGKDTTEQMWALRLAPLLIVQLGGDEGISLESLNQVLLSTVQDKSVSFDSRAKCCTTLGFVNFLVDAEISDLLILMKCFEDIFSASYLKGDDKTPLSVSAEAGTLHAKALSAWGLLLTLIPPRDFVSWMTSGNGQSIMPSFKKLMGLLKSPHLAVRMAAGETLALILDCGRAHDAEFLNEHLNDLIEAVKPLAADSHKYRAKRDRKVQKPLLRDFLRYLEEDVAPKNTILFGTESLVLDSWRMHHQYSSLCVIMGPGMTTQLQENDFIRDVLKLGNKPDPQKFEHVFASYYKRKYMKKTSKARAITRAGNRDIRADAFT